MSKSILSNERRCYVCGKLYPLHKHHIFFGSANRRNSETWGCWVFLCYKHHNGSNRGVHFYKKLDTALKQQCQRRFEEIHGREKFIEVFGKNYL